MTLQEELLRLQREFQSGNRTGKSASNIPHTWHFFVAPPDRMAGVPREAIPHSWRCDDAKQLVVLSEKPNVIRSHDKTHFEAVPISEAEFRTTFRRPVRRIACLGQPDEYYFLPTRPTEAEIDQFETLIDSQANSDEEV